MGQGYSLNTLPAGSAGLDSPETADLTYEKSLGKSSRFMKCIRARYKDGLVITKVFMKPTAKTDLTPYIKRITYERQVLTSLPNTLPYHRIIETAETGYLIRQYINNSLYDRVSTRPFLESIEKKWLAYQLLCAVRDCHMHDIYHGDIKNENCLLTSWNWLFLTDFSSSFKPTYLPEDNPAEFTYFFDTSGQYGRDRTCYLAPERFLRTDEKPEIDSLNWAMDIFSVGCVIGELFTDQKFFTLAGILKYRLSKDTGSFNPLLNEILDTDVREMVAHMIQVNPTDRYRAEDYLTFWKHKVFPEYFYSSLHQYMNSITDPSLGQAPLTSGSENLGETDDRILKIYDDFDKIAYFLGYGETVKVKQQAISEADLFPLEVDLPNSQHLASSDLIRPPDDGSLIFLTVILESIRHCARATSKVRGCELLLAFAERIPDEAKLDRIVPYLVQLMNDSSDMVKVAAVRTLTQILALVTVLRLENAFIFPEYLLPSFNKLITSSEKRERPSSWVRATYASCLGLLSTTASRFLDIVQTQTPADPSTSDIDHHQIYDVARQDLIEQFEFHTKTLLTDNDASVRRALLPCVSTICVFFGKVKASYVILGYLNTYINDKDRQLRCAFFDAIVGVSTYMGTAVVEEFILPLMIQALADPEEMVVQHLITALSSIAELGIFQSTTLWDLIDIIARFTMHPNIWIREAATHFITASAKFANIGDKLSIISPLIKDFCKVTPINFDTSYLLDIFKKPLPRHVLELSFKWAGETKKSKFWKRVEKSKVFAFSPYGDYLTLPPNRPIEPKTLSKLPKTEEDDNWFQRLRNSGLEYEDEFKLLVLQEFIWRSALRKTNTANDINETYSQMVSLTELSVPLQTVIFDNKSAYDTELNSPETKELGTLADALQDATSTEATTSRRDSQSMKPPSRPFNIATRQGINSPDSFLSPTFRGANAGEPSSYDSRYSVRNLDISQSIQRRGSAINLLGQKEALSKSPANVTTDTTNATGKVERNKMEYDQRNGNGPNATKFKRLHNYGGNNPNILKLLDLHQLDNSPLDFLEFGQIVAPSKNEPLRPGGNNSHRGLWTPEGILIAMLNEHTASVNRVISAPDHKFFITGSDDGTIKVWETARLERTVNHRARFTHNQGANVQITSLSFVENTHCFISSGSDGSINIVRVYFPSSSSVIPSSSRGLQLIREYQLPQGEYSQWTEHVVIDSKSILFVTTNKSNTYAIDIRTMQLLYTLSTPARHGVTLCFCVDRAGQWLLLGTSHGILDLWDLRFRLLVKSYSFGTGLPINRILQPLSRPSRRSRVAIAGGAPGTIIALDLEHNAIKEVYKSHIPSPTTTSSTETPNPSPRKHASSSSSSSSISAHHAAVPTLIDITDDPGSSATLHRTTQTAHSTPPDSSARNPTVRALAMAAHLTETGDEGRHAYYAASGPDWRVVFWDSSGEGNCGIVSGGGLDDGTDEGGRRKIMEGGSAGEAMVVVEREIRVREKGGSSSGAGAAGSGSDAKGGGKSIVSLQSRDLLRGHKDDVTDLAFVESPYGMVVSVDRGGMVYVWA